MDLASSDFEAQSRKPIEAPFILRGVMYQGSKHLWQYVLSTSVFPIGNKYSPGQGRRLWPNPRSRPA